MIECISIIVLAIGSVGTLAGAWYVYKTLKASHDWNRRQYALDMLREWNANTAKHARAIEDVFPHVRDVDRTTGKVNELTREEAKKIYTCGRDNEKYWGLRFHMVELLNYFECIAIAYSQKVADNTIVLISLENPMIRWHDILRNFIDVVKMCEGYEPWLPYTNLISEWKAKTIEQRQPTA